MPSRSSHRKDPFPNITGWDDGYEYIRPDGPVGGGARDLPRPPLGRDADNYHPRQRYPSPVSAANTFSRPRNRRNDTSPPRRTRRMSPSPDRRGRETRYPPMASQGRPARPLDRAPPHPMRSESTRERPRPGMYSRSPSPVRARRGRDDFDYKDSYRRAESPPRAARGRGGRPMYSRSPSPSRYPPRPQNRARRAETYRAPSPPPAVRERPGLTRSKTTTAKSKGFTGISPKWQKAATAAFQAGSAAAFNLRSEPGAWKGDKGFRVASAALGAGAFDAFGKGGGKSGDRDRGSKPTKKRSDMEALGGALGGLILDQIAARAGGGKKKH